MDVVLIIIGIILLLIGFAGCIIPGIPGPPIAYIGLLIQVFKTENPFTTKFLIIWALIMIGVSALDYIVPVLGTKKFGGSKRGVWGSVIGLFAGIFFFPPIGLIVGPFLGAFIGELSGGKETESALKAGFGSFIGFITGVVLKLVVTGLMAYYFFGSFV
ncbi:MAG: DUF456 domain-containing protein [Cyclobacteriaceae bacterium]|jgi:uncharacterized protein YqgC (DUF456 family)